MKKVFLTMLSIVFIVSCSNKSEDNKISNTEKDSMTINESEFVVDKIPNLCFAGRNGKDSVYVKLTDNLGTVTGKNITKFAENDSIVVGELMGFKSGDTLKLEVISGVAENATTKEMWFLNNDNELIGAVGSHNEEGRYSSPSSVKFEGGITLKKINCENFDKKSK